MDFYIEINDSMYNKYDNMNKNNLQINKNNHKLCRKNTGMLNWMEWIQHINTGRITKSGGISFQYHNYSFILLSFKIDITNKIWFKHINII